MQQRQAFAREFDHARIVQELRAAGVDEPLAEKEVPVAVHDMDFYPRVGERAQSLRDFRGQRIGLPVR
ncbi:hypothetical protein D3C83_110860 [compost metagenome]